jgi:hypothetical protein
MIFDLLAICYLMRVRPVDVMKGARFVKRVALPLPRTTAEAIARVKAIVEKELERHG